MSSDQKITTCLWFDDNAEEAVRFYTGIFKNSRVLAEVRNPPNGPGPEGSVLVAPVLVVMLAFLLLFYRRRRPAAAPAPTPVRSVL